ncbi:protocatechuate 3,4-dioxygenase [Chromatiales bacterium (ex Bugula neritina AB1)]|nr:protocatechuate 3,4-dioxygenase [Chromatiales bacterium (ex Bugula neritina AB1)]
MALQKITRRTLLKNSTVLAGSAAFSGTAASAILTPPSTEGPFYPKESMRTADIDNDLVKVTGMVEKAGGEIFILKGRILSKDGSPRAGHRVEIWQCDVNGRYLHTGDKRDIPYDTGFQGFGHDITDDAGNYRFRTIKPTRYPGRTPHIHVKVCEGERELLTTQLYIAGEADNASDGIFQRLSNEQAKSVSMVITALDNSLEAQVDLII